MESCYTSWGVTIDEKSFSFLYVLQLKIKKRVVH